MNKNKDMKEVWKPLYINREKTYYEISDTGIVISNYAGKRKTRKVHDNCHGYLGLKLMHKRKEYTRRIHRLVAENFIENPLNLPEVNHINHDKRDNRKDNLEWGTKKHNAKEAAKYGKLSRGGRKLPPKPIGKYFAGILLKKYPSLGSVVKDGYPRISVDRAAQKNKNYKGFYWKFIE
jgi:hypothetical protein